MSGSEQTALVLGGTRGIGRVISVELAKAGYKQVFLNYLQNDEQANTTKLDIENLKCRCTLIRANLAFPDEIDRIFCAVGKETGHLDTMIHSAALGAFKPLIDTKANQWDLSLNVNTRSFLLCAQKCLKLMPTGAIVAISSLGGQKFVPNYSAIGPSKAALESVVRTLAVELGPRGIRVNAVSGGLVQTDSLRQFPNFETLIRETSGRTPAGRIGQPEDIADAVLFLISERATWIVGQTIIVDGGVSLL